MACVRTQPDTQASDLRMVTSVLDQFTPGSDTRPAPQTAISKAIERETEGLPFPLRAILQRRGQLLARDLQDLKSPGLLRIAGSRAHLLDVLITVLRSLKPGDICKAVTTPTFFFEGNMGPYGRITSALHLAAMRGVRVDWILVVDERSLRERRVAEVLVAQGQGATEMQGCDAFNMQFAVPEASLYRRILKRKLTFIKAGPPDDQEPSIILAPDYRGEAGNMSVLRLWSTRANFTRKVEFESIFRDLKMRARPVQRYRR